MTHLAQTNHYRSARLRVFGIPFFALLFLLSAAALISMNSAHAQSASDGQKLECAVHEKMTKVLGAKYTEAPTSLGLAANGKVLELFSAKGGETWTMVLTAPEGVSCIVAAGKYWQEIPAKLEGPNV